MKTRTGWVLLGLLLASSVACEDGNGDQGPVDSALDGPALDASADLATPDGMVDSMIPADTRDASVDLAQPDISIPADTWAPSLDQAPPDVTTPVDIWAPSLDQAAPDGAVDSKIPVDTTSPLPKKKITFAMGSSFFSMTLHTINSDGTNLAKMPGFGTLDLAQSLVLRGRPREASIITSDRPQRGDNYIYAPVLLPSGKGRLRWYRDSSANEVGLLHSKPDGTVTPILSRTGSSTKYLNPHIAVSDSGTFVGAQSFVNRRLLLARTDGKTFPNGKSHVEWPLKPAYHMYESSISVTEKGLFLVTRPSASSTKHSLWWAPTTGAQAPKLVSFPAANGASPAYINPYTVGSRDGSRLAVTVGGASSTMKDVFVVDAASGKATRITKSSGNHLAPELVWGVSASHHSVDLSAKGTHVAYIRLDSKYDRKLYVAKADGTGTPVEVSTGANFNGTKKRFYSVRWATDDVLVFTGCGSSQNYMDIFTYQVSSNTLRNASAMQDTTKPFSLPTWKFHEVGAMWFSQDRKHLYYIAFTDTPYQQDLKGIELATGKKIHVTSGALVSKSVDNFASCGGGSRLFFGATPKSSSGSKILQLFMFDMHSPAKAAQLTKMTNSYSTTKSYILDMTANEDCSLVSFSSGFTYYDAYSVRAKAPVFVSKLTDVKSSTVKHVFDYMGYSQDGSQVVYFAGPATDKYKMYVAPAVLGPGSKPKMIYAGSGSTRHWMYFGTN